MPRTVRFIDCSLRDGHQSLLATRMSTAQCMRVLPMLKSAGYKTLELWGGATLDAALRFTGDDPWERLDAFRAELGPDIEIRSLCRGQNLFGYSPYPDQLVYSFVKEAVRSGNDRVRIFDALNDARNLQTAIMTVKTFNGHAECAMSYTTSPVHDNDHFLRFATAVMDNGATSLAIKDMAGLLHPSDCFELVTAIREKFGDELELSLHSHCTNGLATVAYIAGMIAGADNVDTCYGPMAGVTSQPPVELMSWFAKVLEVDHGTDLSNAGEIDAALREIRGELKDVDRNADRFGGPWAGEPDAETMRKVERVCELVSSRDRDKIDEAIGIVEDDLMVAAGYPPVDRTQLDAQVPGGMISNLHNQLKEQGQLQQLPKILEEVPRVRAEAGYVPLVTPTSQIVGTQAAMNVMTGDRYSMMTNEFRNMVLGLYGRTPAEPDPEVVKKAAPDGKTFTKRPGDYAPEIDWPKTTKELQGLSKSDRDTLLYLLFPAPAKKFLSEREGAV